METVVMVATAAAAGDAPDEEIRAAKRLPPSMPARALAALLGPLRCLEAALAIGKRVTKAPGSSRPTDSGEITEVLAFALATLLRVGH